MFVSADGAAGLQDFYLVFLYDAPGGLCTACKDAAASFEAVSATLTAARHDVGFGRVNVKRAGEVAARVLKPAELPVSVLTTIGILLLGGWVMWSLVSGL